ncbi:tyrosine-type recombinase/integrase [Fischerella sp. PCC 9605]|uniref:tyrosine-type recombinase/integrase n=1 Tax=Fischerella sp. PCC 9605 TaxID=1173024 RepID=UPI0004B44486|nr:tyrosine-type recombinase/integrase [Fischerella sp. PCC 9605]
MKTKKYLKKPLMNSGLPQLQLIKTKPDDVISSEITCPSCGSGDYHKAGTNRCGKQRYRCKGCHRRFVENPANAIGESDDVLSATKLGLRVNTYQRSGEKLNFSKIKQVWFKELAIKYIRYKAGNRELGTLRACLTAFRSFSEFLFKTNYAQGINDINRSVIIDYLEFLNRKKLSPQTKNERLTKLAGFFEAGVVNDWFDVPPHLIRKEDYQKEIKPLPRYIPEEVMHQLNQHIDELPAPIMRMVLVIQECGLRIGELCQLPFNCLKQDAKGGWFIQFMRWKMKKETTLPISIELSTVIQEQQQYIRDNLGEYQYLFCGRAGGNNKSFSSEPKIMSVPSFVGCLKKLSEEFDIRDNSGIRWNFQTHQFRHTVGTRMINNGVPQHIIQRYLGHDSPQMTSVYAHIHDATLRKEIDKYLGTKIVNINGEVIESLTSELDNDTSLQWMKKKVLAETLSNGYCGLPAQLTCSKGNACLTCSDFRTTIEFLDQHKEHLERTKKVLEVAEANGWQRQIQVNEDVKKSLGNIINTLEENKNE